MSFAFLYIAKRKGDVYFMHFVKKYKNDLIESKRFSAFFA